MNVTDFVLKGHVFYSKSLNEIACVADGYVVCLEGISAGVYADLPDEYSELPIYDFDDRLIIPGLVDLHTHAPQFAIRGLGTDLELLDWLKEQVFAEEAKFADAGYAEKAYSLFADELKRSATTRACVYGTIHVEATEILMQLLDDSGVCCMAGKVNMDRNAPNYLCEADAAISAEATRKWLHDTAGRFRNVSPIITPRFIPSCSDPLMDELSKIQKKCGVAVQSHLSENPDEIEWVRQLCPDTGNYAGAYAKHGLLGKGCPTIMAHCVYSTDEEMDILKENGVFVAHCPQSNTNLSSGIAPVRKFLDRGIHVGLGSDIAGGTSLPIFRAMTDAIQSSKLYWRMVDKEARPLSTSEAFYMATKGGGAFFGKVGSFEPGYAFDAVVLDDSSLDHPQPLSLPERLDRAIYLHDELQICCKYADGRRC